MFPGDPQWPHHIHNNTSQAWALPQGNTVRLERDVGILGCRLNWEELTVLRRVISRNVASHSHAYNCMLRFQEPEAMNAPPGDMSTVMTLPASVESVFANCHSSADQIFTVPSYPELTRYRPSVN